MVSLVGLYVEAFCWPSARDRRGRGRGARRERERGGCELGRPGGAQNKCTTYNYYGIPLSIAPTTYDILLDLRQKKDYETSFLKGDI